MTSYRANCNRCKFATQKSVHYPYVAAAANDHENTNGPLHRVTVWDGPTSQYPRTFWRQIMQDIHALAAEYRTHHQRYQGTGHYSDKNVTDYFETYEYAEIIVIGRVFPHLRNNSMAPHGYLRFDTPIALFKAGFITYEPQTMTAVWRRPPNRRG